MIKFTRHSNSDYYLTTFAVLEEGNLKDFMGVVHKDRLMKAEEFLKKRQLHEDGLPLLKADEWNKFFSSLSDEQKIFEKIITILKESKNGRIIVRGTADAKG